MQEEDILEQRTRARAHTHMKVDGAKTVTPSVEYIFHHYTDEVQDVSC
jgi:hypothetical protein